MATVNAKRGGVDVLTGRAMGAPVAVVPAPGPVANVLLPAPAAAAAVGGGAAAAVGGGAAAPVAQRSMIRYQPRQEKMGVLIQDLKSGALAIPEHQREFVWNLFKKQALVDTILRGLPIPTVLIGSTINDPKRSIEDGRQRLTTIQHFMEGEFTTHDGRKFAALSMEEQFGVSHYMVPVTEYSGATDSERFDIFDRHQNGTPLSTGERLHSLTSCSPAVSFARENLMKVGTPISNRFFTLWGDRVGGDKRKNNLANAVAIVLGLAFGPRYISKKYEEIRDKLAKPINEAGVLADLGRVAEIYEEVQKKEPGGNKTVRNRMFNCGIYLGYILYSLSYKARKDTGAWVVNSLEGDEGEWKRLKDGWVKYLIRARRKDHQDGGVLDRDEGEVVRHWSSNRWELGYLRVFDPKNPRVDELLKGEAESPDDEED